MTESEWVEQHRKRTLEQMSAAVQKHGDARRRAAAELSMQMGARREARERAQQAYSAAKAAEIIDVTPATIARWAADGTIPADICFKHERRWYFDIAGFTRFAERLSGLHVPPRSAAARAKGLSLARPVRVVYQQPTEPPVTQVAVVTYKKPTEPPVTQVAVVTYKKPDADPE